MVEINEENFPSEWNIPISDKKLRKAVFKAFKGKCFYSGRTLTLENMHIDHVIPRAKGGPDNIYNYALCADEINLVKNKSLDWVATVPMLGILRTVYVKEVIRNYKKECEPPSKRGRPPNKKIKVDPAVLENVQLIKEKFVKCIREKVLGMDESVQSQSFDMYSNPALEFLLLLLSEVKSEDEYGNIYMLDARKLCVESLGELSDEERVEAAYFEVLRFPLKKESGGGSYPWFSSVTFRKKSLILEVKLNPEIYYLLGFKDSHKYEPIETPPKYKTFNREEVLSRKIPCGILSRMAEPKTVYL